MTINKSHLFMTIFLLGLFVMGLNPTCDPDLGWHLKTGQVILQQGIPKTDIFSYTVLNQPWILHEWLSEVILFQLYRLGQFSALILFSAFWMIPTFIWVYRRAPEKKYIAVLTCLMGASIVHTFWGARPQIFNIVMLSLFLWVLEGIKLKKLSVLWMWILPFLLALWVNLHSGFVLGVVVVGLFWFSECLESRFQRGAFALVLHERYKILAVLCACLIAGGLVNPYGFKIFSYPLVTLGNSVQQESIAEWQSPDFHFLNMRLFLIFLLLSIGSIMITLRKLSWFEMILYLGSLVAGLVSIRHIPFFVIVAVPMMCRNFNHAFAFSDRLFKDEVVTRRYTFFHLALIILLMVGVASFTKTFLNGNLKKMDEANPVDAVRFLKQKEWQNLRGFHPYEWGGYLIWQNIPVFIDGRADLYHDQVLKDYLIVANLDSGWEDVLSWYKVDYVLAPISSVSFDRFLKQSKSWSLAYADSCARVFKRQGPV